MRMKEDMNAKAATATSIKNRFSYKVRAILIDSFLEKYLVTTKEGRSVENWQAINRDCKKLEKMCKGKIPESTQQIIQLLSEEETDVSLVTPRKTTSARNPYKWLWEERGITWPHSTTSPYGCSQQGATCAPQAGPCSSDVFLQQDEYLLNVAIKEKSRKLHGEHDRRSWK